MAPILESAASTTMAATHAPAAAVAARRRVRILYIVDQLTEMGGTERVLVKMIRSLPARFPCSVVTFRMDDRLALFSHMPCDVQVFPLRKSYDLRALRLALKLRRLIRRERVDIVHTFFETADIWGGFVARLSGVPILISSRRDMGILREKKHALAYRLMSPLFTRVLTVSEQVRKYCVGVDRLRPERVETLYNGIELATAPVRSRAACKAHFGLTDFKQVVLTVGNIRRVKGIDVFLHAAARVCKVRPATLFLVVGDNHDPAYFRELEELTSRLGLSNNVRFHGSSEEVQELLSASDVFCLPSRSEGFSNALIEAMGAGLPCVATNVGGNAEAIESGRNGVLVPPDNADALASAVGEMLDHPEHAQVLGRQAGETVRARFTHEAMMTNVARIYDRLVADAEHRP